MSFFATRPFDPTPGLAFEAFRAGTYSPMIPQALYRRAAAGPRNLTAMGLDVGSYSVPNNLIGALVGALAGAVVGTVSGGSASTTAGLVGVGLGAALGYFVVPGLMKKTAAAPVEPATSAAPAAAKPPIGRPTSPAVVLPELSSSARLSPELAEQVQAATAANASQCPSGWYWHEASPPWYSAGCSKNTSEEISGFGSHSYYSPMRSMRWPLQGVGDLVTEIIGQSGLEATVNTAWPLIQAKIDASLAPVKTAAYVTAVTASLAAVFAFLGWQKLAVRPVA